VSDGLVDSSPSLTLWVRFNIYMQNTQFIYEYSGFNGTPSTCRFSFFKTVTGLTLCIADELPTNKGTPIREFAEQLATHAYREVFAPHGAHIEEFLYVEHAPISATTLEYSYALVDFEWDEAGMQFIHPSRTTLTNEEIQALRGETKIEEQADSPLLDSNPSLDPTLSKL